MPDKLDKFYIVKEHPLRIMSKCKSHAKGTLISFFAGFCLLYAAINWIPQLLSLAFPATNVDLFAAYTDVDPAELSKLPATPLVVFFYMMMFSGVFKLSECLYALTYIRNRKVDYRALGESFSYYFKALGIFLLQILVVSFWTMFFIIPGILAALNFSQVYYILADNPEKSITEVLSESKMMMYGNRWNYVRLIVFYMPYYMIAYFPALLFASIAAESSLNSTLVMILSMITDIPIFCALGYMCLGRTVFYELMINKGFAYFKYAGQDTFRQLEEDPNAR